VSRRRTASQVKEPRVLREPRAEITLGATRQEAAAIERAKNGKKPTRGARQTDADADAV
jgi:hypothetical protein